MVVLKVEFESVVEMGSIKEGVQCVTVMVF